MRRHRRAGAGAGALPGSRCSAAGAARRGGAASLPPGGSRGGPLWLRLPRGSGSRFPGNGPGEKGESLGWKSGAAAEVEEGTLFSKKLDALKKKDLVARWERQRGLG